MIITAYKVAKVTKEARDYFSSKEGSEGVLAGAFIINSILERTIINFFVMITKPKLPVRFFTDEYEAIQWLEQFKIIY